MPELDPAVLGYYERGKEAGRLTAYDPTAGHVAPLDEDAPVFTVVAAAKERQSVTAAAKEVGVSRLTYDMWEKNAWIPNGDSCSVSPTTRPSR